MGGTSTDVALLQDGRCRLAAEATVHGYPDQGADARHPHRRRRRRLDRLYRQRRAPEGRAALAPAPIPARSATATATTEPAVTDANVVLQTLNPEHLLGGRMKIRRDSAERGDRAAWPSGWASASMETAQGILSVVTANMARAIRVISVQRGHDPRDYTLMAFGGAGPLHAARLARELEIGRVLVPANPGILCAMGLLLTDLRADFALTRLLPATEASTRRRRRGLRRARRARRPLVRARGHRAADRAASRAPSTCATTARTTS